MGCCGSREAAKNTVSPEGKDAKLSSNIEIRIEAPAEEMNKKVSKDSNNNSSPQTFRRSKTSRPPEPLKEIEVVESTSLRGHTQNVDICRWSPSGNALISAGTDRQVLYWPLDLTNKVLSESTRDIQPQKMDLPNPSDSASCLAWSDDCKFVAIGTDRGFVVLFSIKDQPKSLDDWQPHSNATKDVKINGDYVLSVGDIVCVYLISKKLWFRTAWNDSPLTACEWMSSRQFLVAEFSGDITLDIVEPSQFIEISRDFDIPADVPGHRFRSHKSGIYKLVKHPTRSKLFASCSVDCTVKIWTLESSSPIKTLDGHFGYVLDIEWVPEESDSIVSGSFDGSVKLWDVKKGKCVKSMDEHRGQVSKLSVSTDSRYLATAGHDGYINFWSLTTGELINSYEGSGRMLQVAFNENGAFVVASSYGSVDLLRLKYSKVAQVKDTKEKSKKRRHRED